MPELFGPPIRLNLFTQDEAERRAFARGNRSGKAAGQSERVMGGGVELGLSEKQGGACAAHDTEALPQRRHPHIVPATLREKRGCNHGHEGKWRTARKGIAPDRRADTRSGAKSRKAKAGMERDRAERRRGGGG